LTSCAWADAIIKDQLVKSQAVTGGYTRQLINAKNLKHNSAGYPRLAMTVALPWLIPLAVMPVTCRITFLVLDALYQYCSGWGVAQASTQKLFMS